ncbi:MAG: peroxide stress protein YaaA [Verrucomicrobiales bacterium]
MQTDRLPARVVAPVFKDEKNGVFKIISFYAKRARGMMADFIIRHRLKNPGDLSAFNSGGYYFSEGESTPDQPVFLRAEQKK